jgi:protein-tyrosine phosphatase
MIDTHAHLLPHWDDGADSWETSLAMLKMAEEDGIAEVVCTPHIMSQQDFRQEETLIARYEELKQRATAEGINLTIHMGAEIMIHSDLNLKWRMATPAANGKYFLVEFPMSLTPETVVRSFLDVAVSEKTPVIAHPERYLRIIKNPMEATSYVERGAILQVNAGSLTGIFGQIVQEVALQLIDSNLANVVASDAHDLRSRPLRLSSAYKLVADRLGNEKATRLFQTNPRRMILGQPIFQEPVSAPAQTKKSRWGFSFGKKK